MNTPGSTVQEVQLDKEYLHSLLRLSKKLELAHDYPAIIHALTSEIETMLGYHTVWVYLITDDPNMAHLLTAQEDVGITDKLPTLDFRDDAFLQEIAAADHIVIVEDATTDPRTNKEIVAMLGNRSIINVPVQLADKKIGMIGTGSFGEEGVHLPDQSQLDFLSALASHTAVALDRIRLYQERLEAEEEKRQMQDQIAHVQRLESLGLLAGGIAHDFNNILTAILGNAALAESKLKDHAEARDHLHRITSASRRATDLCKQMLAYAGHRNIQPKAIDLSELLQDMGALLEVSIGKSIRIEYHLQEGLPSILGDIAQIQQIMMNLITNANEAIGDQAGCITIRTGHIRIDPSYLSQLTHAKDATEGDYVFCEISDNGCGMDKTVRENLFDPFFTTKLTGRGLGMSAVLGIIQSHHGAMNLYSEPGEGSSFKILFPAVDRLAEPLTETIPVDMPTPDATVLVIDDEEIVRETTVLILEDMGFKVLAAENGRQALDILRQHLHDIDLALLDMTMPDMDGVETLHELRLLNPHLPVIILSGYSQQDTAQRFAERQPNGFIQKPFLPDDLELMLHRILQQASANTEH